MAFRKLYDLPPNFNQPPAMGAPPSPAYNPMAGTTQYGGGMTTKFAPSPMPTPAPAPGGFGGAYKSAPYAPNVPQNPKGYQAPNVTPFLWNMFGSMKSMDQEERAGYLENIASGIKDKLDQYGLRLARGRTLTPEQQARYDSLRSSFNDIQGYVTNQSAYDDYLTKLGGNTPDQYAEQQRRSAEFRRSRGMPDANGIYR